MSAMYVSPNQSDQWVSSNIVLSAAPWFESCVRTARSVLTQCVVHEMANMPQTILSPDVIRQLQAATDEDDPTAWVSSYKYNCKVPLKYKAGGEYSMDLGMDLQNEILAHTTSALHRTYTTSRQAAGLFMLWHASSKQVQETDDLEGVPDPSFVSLADAKKLFTPVMQKGNIGSGYDSLLPGPASDGSYSSLPHSTPPSPTLVLPF
ncbi:hypothetical protein DXG01_000486 [Tephrocybe rancida]|nr:hypothetical protein DXG01_000486 [Tephrocybe rancida]